MRRNDGSAGLSQANMDFVCYVEAALVESDVAPFEGAKGSEEPDGPPGPPGFEPGHAVLDSGRGKSIIGIRII